MPRETHAFEAHVDLHCYDCGHDYDHIGSGNHPGVCPACGSRAVSLSGDPTVRDVFEDDGLSDAEMTSINVVVEDDTDRAITFVAKSFEGSVRLELAILGSGARIQAGAEAWRSSLVPESVVETLEDRGATFVPCSGWDGAGGGPMEED